MPGGKCRDGHKGPTNADTPGHKGPMNGVEGHVTLLTCADGVRRWLPRPAV